MQLGERGAQLKLPRASLGSGIRTPQHSHLETHASSGPQVSAPQGTGCRAVGGEAELVSTDPFGGVVAGGVGGVAGPHAAATSAVAAHAAEVRPTRRRRGGLFFMKRV